MNCLGVFDHFLELVLKRLKSIKKRIFCFVWESDGLHKSEFHAQAGVVLLRIYINEFLKKNKIGN